MDWATFFKEYQAIITVLSGLLLAGLGYIFGKWHAERNRKWELEDRDFNRRATIRDMRIKEAREYVDSLEEMVRFMLKVNSTYEEESDGEKRLLKLRRISENYNDSDPESIKKGMSLYLLEDKELGALHENFADLLSGATELRKGLEKRDSEEEKIISDALKASQIAVLRMKKRLDELAEKVL